MFEDSLVESASRIRTRARHYVAGSFFVEAALLSTLVLLPYFFPEALPRKFLSIPILAPPPPPAAPAPAPQRAAAAPAHPSELLRQALIAPPVIPRAWMRIVDTAPPAVNIPRTADFDSARTGSTGLTGLGPVAPPPAPRVRPARPAGPVRVSEGVAAGQLVVPIQPQYPAIAVETRMQGTVVVAAVIGTDGRIASLRVLTGPPLLVSAAVTAIRQARYRPWTLNGQPVEVETTISVVFSLGAR